MQIRFMGTGAADFSPLLETEYKYKLDQNARRSSSILLEGNYLIDCGPHVAGSFQIQQIDAAKVKAALHKVVPTFKDPSKVNKKAENAEEMKDVNRVAEDPVTV